MKAAAVWCKRNAGKFSSEGFRAGYGTTAQVEIRLNDCRAVSESGFRQNREARDGPARCARPFRLAKPPVLIRCAAEVAAREFYGHRAPAEWLEVLAPFGTGPENRCSRSSRVIPRRMRECR